jgi:hypothetical protein
MATKAYEWVRQVGCKEFHKTLQSGSLNGNQIQYSHHGPWLDFVKYFEFT